MTGPKLGCEQHGAVGRRRLFECFEAGEAEALGLGREVLAALNPSLVHVSITPFGSDGPKAGWAVSDLVLQASAVNMAVTGDKDRAPLRAGGTLPQAMHNAASEAAGAALIALWERQTRSGLGQHIDMSAQQSMSQASMSSVLNTSLNATVTQRIAGGASLQGIDIQLMWACADGHASVTFLFGPGFRAFTQNLMDWVFEEGFCDEATRDKDWVEYAMMLLDGREPVSEYERLKQILTEFFATKTKAELLDAAMSRRLLITPVSTTAEVVDAEQLAVREYWEDVDHSDVVRDAGAGSFDPAAVRYPGAFAKFSESPLVSLPRAPMLGEHTDEVLAELDGAGGAGRAPAVAASVRGRAPALLERTANGRIWEAAGNRDLVYAPQGATGLRRAASAARITTTTGSRFRASTTASGPRWQAPWGVATWRR